MSRSNIFRTKEEFDAYNEKSINNLRENLVKAGASSENIEEVVGRAKQFNTLPASTQAAVKLQAAMLKLSTQEGITVDTKADILMSGIKMHRYFSIGEMLDKTLKILNKEIQSGEKFTAEQILNLLIGLLEDASNRAIEAQDVFCNLCEVFFKFSADEENVPIRAEAFDIKKE
jgi:hypothetical protein